MSLFEKKSKQKETEPLTPEKAQELYGTFRGGRKHTQMFLEDGVPFSESEEVWWELKALEAEVMLKMSGVFVVKPGIPAVYDPETGELVKKAVDPVYFKVTTQKALAGSLKSELLDVAVLVDDCRKYSDGNPDDPPDWNTWLESFKKEL